MRLGAGDQAHRAFALALWALLRCAQSGGREQELRAAARLCLESCEDARNGEPHFVLQLRGGALHGNGARIRPDVAHFAPTSGLVALMQDRHVSDMLVLASATEEDFVGFARAFLEVDGDRSLGERLLARGCGAIQVGQDGVESDADFVATSGAEAAALPSQLGAVFVMQRFANALERRGPLAGLRARTILQNVLHHMLREKIGLESLSLLPRDAAGIAEAVRAGVLAALTAEQLAWKPTRCMDAAVAALVGQDLVAQRDGEAAQLGVAARSVARLLAAAERPSVAVDQAQQDGAISDAIGEAMELVLASR